MQGLVTDRTQANVLRRAELAAKGWSGMTAEEQEEWLGSPFSSGESNLIPYGPYYSSAVSLKWMDDALIATTSAAGTYLYAVLILGDAEKFTPGGFYSLEAEAILSDGGGNPQCALYWHDDSGYELAGMTAYTETDAGVVTTFQLAENSNSREYLALYVYVTADAAVEAGASVRFNRIRLFTGFGQYKPYTEILPNDTTKGAYNYSDLNRVERAVSELSDIYGLNLDTKTDWNIWDVPQKSDMLRYITNIKKIRQACLNPNSVSAAPDSMDGLNYNDANNIEKILLAASENTDRVYRCGELSCGEV